MEKRGKHQRERNWRRRLSGTFSVWVLNAAIVGIALLTAEGMKDAGLGINEPLLRIAREYGWSGEIPSQERYMLDRDDSYGAG